MIRTKSERFFVDVFDTISFPLEDKQVVNEHHVIPKSRDATLKKCRHVVHFNVPLIKNVTLKAAKKAVGVAVYWEEH